MALASTGLLLTCIQDNYSGASSSKLSSSFGGGRIIFGMDELPLHTSWQTPAGHFLCRVADSKLNYFVGPAHQSLLGAEVYGVEVRPLAKTIEYLPQHSLVHVLTFLPPADYVACRLVSRFWRKVIDEQVMSEEVSAKLTERINRFAQNHFARLPTELVLHVFGYLRAKDLSRICQTSFGFWSLVNHNEDRLWQALFKRRWVHSRDKLMEAHGCSWKLWYILNDRLLRAKCLLGHHKELLADFLEHVPRGLRAEHATAKAKESRASAGTVGDEVIASTSTIAGGEGKESESESEKTNAAGDDDDWGKLHGWHWPLVGDGSGTRRVESKHPESAAFLRTTLREVDSRHFFEERQQHQQQQQQQPPPPHNDNGKAQAGGNSGHHHHHRVSANVLVIGAKGIGKSSFVMKALTDRFESNPEQLDLDQFGANVTKQFPMKSTSLNLRVFTLCRIPDYNDLFNVAAVIVAYDLSSASGLSEALRWAKQTRQEGRHNLVVAAVGLRKDLATRKRDETTAAKEMAIRAGVALYCELSALQASGRALTKFFARIARRVAEYPELWVAPIFVPTNPLTPQSSSSS